jgi:hypothetical protein
MTDKQARITRRRVAGTEPAKQAKPAVKELDAAGVVEVVARGMFDFFLGDSSPVQREPRKPGSDADVIDTEGDDT